MKKLAVLFFVLGCGGSSSAPSGVVQRLHGQVVDATGDMLVDLRLPVSPDLSFATVDAGGGALTVVVGFASGTFDRESMAAEVFLDTDQNTSTGAPSSEGVVAGAEFRLSLDARSGVSTAGSISRYSPRNCDQFFLRCFAAAGALTTSVVGNTLQAVVPLSSLDNSDGRLTFQVRAVAVTPTFTFNTDLMPDANLPPGSTQ